MIQRFDESRKLNGVFVARVFRGGAGVTVLRDRDAQPGEAEKIVGITDDWEECDGCKEDGERTPPPATTKMDESKHTDPEP